MEFLQKSGLSLPSTYQGIHSGSSATWQHSSGSLSRTDYIAVRCHVDVNTCSSWVVQDFDLITPNQDHWPVALQVEFAFGNATATEGRAKLRKPRYDRSRVLTPEGRAIIKEEIEQLIIPDWNEHPDMHALAIERSLHCIMQKHFLKQPGRPKAQYISPLVWRVRAVRLDIKRRTRCYGARLRAIIRGMAMQVRKLGTGFDGLW